MVAWLTQKLWTASRAAKLTLPYSLIPKWKDMKLEIKRSPSKGNSIVEFIRV